MNNERTKWYPHQQLQLFHLHVNHRRTLDQIAFELGRPQKEITDCLQGMHLLHKDQNEMFHRIGVAAKTPEEKEYASGI